MTKQIVLACLLAGDGDGFGVNGSVAVHDNVFLFGRYSMQDASEDGVEVDLDALRLGARLIWSLGDRADLSPRQRTSAPNGTSTSWISAASTRAPMAIRWKRASAAS